MFKSKAMNALTAALAKAQNEAAAFTAETKLEDITAKTNEIKNFKARIEAQELLDAGKEFDEKGEEIKDTTPVNTPIVVEPNKKGPFNTFGEQLLAIAKSSRPGAPIDERLLKVQNASGANESIPSEGGFLVQKDFESQLLQEIHQNSVLAAACRRITISAGSNGVKLNGVDESSRADGSRWGGVQAYWVNEAGTVTASKPKYRQIELTLNKLMALYYATDELLQDAPAAGAIMQQAFAEELTFKRDDAIYRGDGAGKPLGVLNSGCLVTVAAESGQAADTVLYENIIKMWSRLIASSRANAVWYINQEVEAQLYGMSLAIGTGGVPVYMPAGGISGQQYGTLFGRPVVPIEHASALGDVGDILLGDFSQYLLADKGGIQSASSMHVQFQYDEMAFRVTYRVDGQPVRSKPITPYKGGAGNTLSSFVTLAAR